MGLILLALVVMALEILAAAEALRQRRWPDPAAAPPDGPPAAVIVPSHGAPPRLAEAARALLNQSYARSRVLFCVDSEADPGAAVLRAAIAEAGWGELIVAGLASGCSQQNHNMLAGVAAAADAPILAFADNDFVPARDWLARLVAALEPAVTVSFGYRWIAARRGGLGPLTLALSNATMLGYLALANRWFGVGLWGGSFALRSADFARLGVRECWARTISDDMTLGRRVASRGGRTRLVPGFLLESQDAAPSLREHASWLRRQILNNKANERVLWLGLVAIAATGLALWGSAVAAVAGWLIGWPPVGARLGAVATAVLAGELLSGVLYGRAGVARSTVVAAAAFPLARWIQGTVVLGTLIGRRIVWAGVEYEFDRRGQVVAVRRGVTTAARRSGSGASGAPPARTER